MAMETRTEVTGVGVTPTTTTGVVPPPLRPLPTTAQSIGLLCARLPLGAFFIFAAVSKLRMGPSKFAEFATTHLPNWSIAHKLPPNFTNTFLNSLPWIELAAGIFLVVGLLGRVAGLVTSLLLISFMAGFTGISGHLAENVDLPFHPNLVLLGLALAVLFCGPGRLSVDGFLFGPRRKVVIREEYTERLA